MCEVLEMICPTEKAEFCPSCRFVAPQPLLSHANVARMEPRSRHKAPPDGAIRGRPRDGYPDFASSGARSRDPSAPSGLRHHRNSRTVIARSACDEVIQLSSLFHKAGFAALRMA